MYPDPLDYGTLPGRWEVHTSFDFVAPLQDPLYTYTRLPSVHPLVNLGTPSALPNMRGSEGVQNRHRTSAALLMYPHRSVQAPAAKHAEVIPGDTNLAGTRQCQICSVNNL